MKKLFFATAFAILMAAPVHAAGWGPGKGATDKAYEMDNGFKQYFADKGRGIFDWKKAKIRSQHAAGLITTAEMKAKLADFRDHRRDFLGWLRSW